MKQCPISGRCRNQLWTPGWWPAQNTPWRPRDGHQVRPCRPPLPGAAPHPGVFAIYRRLVKECRDYWVNSALAACSNTSYSWSNYSNLPVTHRWPNNTKLAVKVYNITFKYLWSILLLAVEETEVLKPGSPCWQPNTLYRQTSNMLAHEHTNDSYTQYVR